MGMAAEEADDMDCGVRAEERRASDRRRPVMRPPRPREERKSGDRIGGADIGYEMRIERAGVGNARRRLKPSPPGGEHHGAVASRKDAENP